MYARGARYHDSCWSKFKLDHLDYKREQEKVATEASNRATAHAKATEEVVKVIENSVVVKH